MLDEYDINAIQQEQRTLARRLDDVEAETEAHTGYLGNILNWIQSFNIADWIFEGIGIRKKRRVGGSVQLDGVAMEKPYPFQVIQDFDYPPTLTERRVKVRDGYFNVIKGGVSSVAKIALGTGYPNATTAIATDINDTDVVYAYALVGKTAGAEAGNMIEADQVQVAISATEPDETDITYGQPHCVRVLAKITNTAGVLKIEQKWKGGDIKVHAIVPDKNDSFNTENGEVMKSLTFDGFNRLTLNGFQEADNFQSPYAAKELLGNRTLTWKWWNYYNSIDEETLAGAVTGGTASDIPYDYVVNNTARTITSKLADYKVANGHSIFLHTQGTTSFSFDDWLESSTSGGVIDGRYWELDGDYQTCFGASIGNAIPEGNNLVIDLDNTELCAPGHPPVYTLNWSTSELKVADGRASVEWANYRLMGVEADPLEPTPVALDWNNRFLDGGNWYVATGLKFYTAGTAYSDVSISGNSLYSLGGIGATNGIYATKGLANQAGVYADSINKVMLADGTYAVNASDGSVNSAGSYYQNGIEGQSITNWFGGGILTGTSIIEIDASDLRSTDKILVLR